ncbi:MAG: ATP-binding cassette domain-containing protein [Clostridia bacterium]|nr:ATP-binding cassette domain-containing protein [Clostridia bacterium]MBR4087595.1 ATP-binding cassette domain-containing protein [Clostridia bacterium]
MIEVKNIVKSYGDKYAVNDISFTVETGEIVGFLGPNGAGKSTTMNILTGYLSANSGTALIDGIDILENPTEAKRLIGFLPEQPPLYMDMTVREYLEFVYDLKKCKFPKKEHLREICELMKIEDVYNRMIKNLSKGYRQRVGFAQALVGNPPILILDEPTVGLDPRQIIEIRKLITRLGKKHTVILSTHILQEVQAVCDRIIVINKGQLVADGNAETLAHKEAGNRRLVARIAGNKAEVKKAIRAMNSVLSCEEMGTKEQGTTDYLIESEPNVDIRKMLFRLLSDRGWILMGLKSMDMSLEDVFVSLITNEGGVEE